MNFHTYISKTNSLDFQIAAGAFTKNCLKFEKDARIF